jgi:hypothetical protein
MVLSAAADECRAHDCRPPMRFQVLLGRQGRLGFFSLGTRFFHARASSSCHNALRLRAPGWPPSSLCPGPRFFQNEEIDNLSGEGGPKVPPDSGHSQPWTAHNIDIDLPVRNLEDSDDNIYGHQNPL